MSAFLPDKRRRKQPRGSGKEIRKGGEELLFRANFEHAAIAPALLASFLRREHEKHRASVFNELAFIVVTTCYDKL
jgi:hypothetical protein